MGIVPQTPGLRLPPRRAAMLIPALIEDPMVVDQADRRGTSGYSLTHGLTRLNVQRALDCKLMSKRTEPSAHTPELDRLSSRE